MMPFFSLKEEVIEPEEKGDVEEGINTRGRERGDNKEVPSG